MALQEILGGMMFPRMPTAANAAPSFTTNALLIDAIDEGACFVVAAPRTGTITKVGWGTRTVTTGATLDVRLEAVAAAAKFPAGTLFGTNTNGSQVVADANDNTWFLTALTTGASVTKGQVFAVVIKNPGASAGTLQIAGFADDSNTLDFPYSGLNTGVSPTISYASAQAAPILAFEYSDAPTVVPIPGCWPMNGTITATAVGTGSTPDIIGLRFKVAFPCRLNGAGIWVDADGDFKVMLVSEAYHQANATGILASLTVDHVQEATTAAAYHEYLFPATYDLVADTYYRLVIEPTTATTLSVYDFDVSTLALMDAYAGGQDFHLTTAKDPTGDGSWTNYNSGTFRKPFLSLNIDKFDDAAQTGGGLIRHPGMAGGCNA